MKAFTMFFYLLVTKLRQQKVSPLEYPVKNWTWNSDVILAFHDACLLLPLSSYYKL